MRRTQLGVGQDIRSEGDNCRASGEFRKVVLYRKAKNDIIIASQVLGLRLDDKQYGGMRDL